MMIVCIKYGAGILVLCGCQDIAGWLGWGGNIDRY
jgi:hypothetical protein